MDRKLIYYFKSQKEAANYLKKIRQKKEEHDRLRKIFKTKNISIEHVGSTAIPNIEAKPIIDILMVVPEESDIDVIIRKLVLAGYYKSSFKLDGEVFLKKTDGICSTHYLHLAKRDQGDWKRYVAFRDYLVQNPNIAKEYETLKIELAKKYTNDRVGYTTEKKIWIDEILYKISITYDS
jgi:GrpB-like predicted nucleotidyltransferase (UPF0157 family)